MPTLYIPLARHVRAFGVCKSRGRTMTERSSQGLDVRRRRLLFRAWRRGVRETDLIVGRFADAYIDKFDETSLDDFERLIEVPNAALYAWVVGAETVPADYDTAVLRQLIGFHDIHDCGGAKEPNNGGAGPSFRADQIAGRAAIARAGADARRHRRRRRRLGAGRSRPRHRRPAPNRRRFRLRWSAATVRAWPRSRARSPSSPPTSRCWNSRPGIACLTTGCRRTPPWWRSA